MSLTSSESRDLKKLADAVVDMSKILKAMNENLLGLANNMTAALEILARRQVFELGDFVKVVDPDSMVTGEVGRVAKINIGSIEVKFASGSGGNFLRSSLDFASTEEYEACGKYWADRRSIAKQSKAGAIGFPEGWSNTDLVQVIDPTREEYGRRGVVVEGRVWSDNAELGVRFGEASMSSSKSYFNPSQLKKIGRYDAIQALRDSAPTVQEAGENIAKAVKSFKEGLE